MSFAVDAAAIAAIVGALASVLTSFALLYSDVKLRRSVATSNALSIGQLASAAESRRITLVLPGERTEQEKEHLLELPVPPRPAVQSVPSDRP
jgi:hypothetical protein